MNTQRISPVSAKLKRGSEHYLNGKPVYIERDRQDGTILISDSKMLRPEDNYWTILKSDLQLKPGKPTLKVVKSTENSSEKKDLNAFYDSLKIPFNCQNCRQPLYAFNKRAKRAVSCHIFPKSKFISIATDPDNIVFMGCDFVGSSCDHHTIWDYSVDNRKKMPIYDLAIKRYSESLKFRMTEKEIVMAEDYLGLNG